MEKSIKEIVHLIISETCTHWICADEKELNRVETELEQKIKDLVNSELAKANVEHSFSNCNLDIVTHSTLDDEMVTILKPKYKAKDGTIKSALSITNLDTNTVKYLARKSDLYCG